MKVRWLRCCSGFASTFSPGIKLVEGTPTHFSTHECYHHYRQFNLRGQGKSGKTINSWCKKEADIVNVYSVPTADTQLFHILWRGKSFLADFRHTQFKQIHAQIQNSENFPHKISNFSCWNFPKLQYFFLELTGKSICWCWKKILEKARFLSTLFFNGYL